MNSNDWTEQLDDDGREKIIRRIHALMAKTTAAGCSEEEALAASNMVERLMLKYQLSMSDVRLKQEAECREGVYETMVKAPSELKWVLPAVAMFTDCKVWMIQDWDQTRYKFFGFDHDVDIALYITKIVDWALTFECQKDTDASEEYRALPAGKKPKCRKDYRTAMAYRVARRLRDMKNEMSREVKDSTGRDLVVVKEAIVTEEFAKLGLNLKTRANRYNFSHMDARAAGTEAGDRVKINPGIGNGRSGDGVKGEIE